MRTSPFRIMVQDFEPRAKAIVVVAPVVVVATVNVTRTRFSKVEPVISPVVVLEAVIVNELAATIPIINKLLVEEPQGRSSTFFLLVTLFVS